MMRSIYMVMNIHIYGTFEKESQWRGASDRSGHIYIIYTYKYINIYIEDLYRRGIRRRIVWDGLFGLKRLS